jgi:endonuclease-3
MKIIPQDRWIAFSHELLHHERQICVARKPRCVGTLVKICDSADKTWSSHLGRAEVCDARLLVA